MPYGNPTADGGGIYLLAIAISYASLKLYDEPLREWLKQKFFAKKATD